MMNTTQSMTIASDHQTQVKPELSFSPDLNLMMIRGNPFNDMEKYQHLINGVKSHLENGNRLNIYIRTHEINGLARVFFRQLGMILNKFNNQISINWSEKSGDKGLIHAGLHLLNRPLDGVSTRIVGI